MSPVGRRAAALVAGLFALVTLALPAGAAAAKKQQKSAGSLVQLKGKRGCIVDKNQRSRKCAFARALKQPGPFMGSRAIQISPDGRNVYVASSTSNAISIFTRDRKRGTLKQRRGPAGCIAVGTGSRCATAVGLNGPNSVAISPDGKSVYATARGSSAVLSFRRNAKTGALTQLAGADGCVTGITTTPVPPCVVGRGLAGADVVTISPDGKNVYAGAFAGNAVAIFVRDPATGVLTQPADETGCLTDAATAGCATGLGLKSPEGMAVSADGASVYVASAVSNAVLSLSRDPATGALTQATDGTGCIVDAALSGCTTGTEIAGANAIALSPGGEQAYVTSLVSSSVTGFGRGPSGTLSQLFGTSGCVEWLGADACSFGRAMRAPEGIAVSPDGRNVYAAAYSSGGIAVLDRDRQTGTIKQKQGTDGCLATQSIANCASVRQASGTSSIAISRDGRFVYSTAAQSNAINVFRRVTKR